MRGGTGLFGDLWPGTPSALCSAMLCRHSLGAIPLWQTGKEALPRVWPKDSFVPPTAVIFWLL